MRACYSVCCSSSRPAAPPIGTGISNCGGILVVFGNATGVLHRTSAAEAQTLASAAEHAGCPRLNSVAIPPL